MVFYQTPFPGPHWRLSSVTGSCWGALSPHGVGQEGTNAGFHHSGGISKPLQVENSLVKLCNSQTACEPQVPGDSKNLLSWM